MFGAGMVLSSGCGAKMLVRLGSGNLKSLVVLVFLALASYMTLRGILGALRVNVFDAVKIAADAHHQNRRHGSRACLRQEVLRGPLPGFDNNRDEFR